MAYVSQRRQKIREEKAIIEQRKQTREQAKEQSVQPTESQGYVSERRQAIRESKAQVQPDVVAPETSVQTAQEPAKKSYAELHREYQAKEKGKAKTTTQEYKPLMPEDVFYRDVVQKSIPNVKSQEKQPVDQSTQTKNLNFSVQTAQEPAKKSYAELHRERQAKANNLNFDDLRRLSDNIEMNKAIPPEVYHPAFKAEKEQAEYDSQKGTNALAYGLHQFGGGVVDFTASPAKFAGLVGDIVTGGKYSEDYKKIDEYFAQYPMTKQRAMFGLQEDPFLAQRIGVDQNALKTYIDGGQGQYLAEIGTHKYSEGLSKFATERLGPALYSVGAQVPTMLMAGGLNSKAASSGIRKTLSSIVAKGGIKGTAAKVANNLILNPQTSIFFARGTLDKMRENMRTVEFSPGSVVNAVSSGYLEALIEGLGGFYENPALGEVVDEVVGSGWKTFWKFVKKGLKDLGEEGIEEFINVLPQKVIDKYTISDTLKWINTQDWYDPNAIISLSTLSESVDAGINGLLAAAIMGGPSIISTTVSAARESKQIREGVTTLNVVASDLLAEEHRPPALDPKTATEQQMMEYATTLEQALTKQAEAVLAEASVDAEQRNTQKEPIAPVKTQEQKLDEAIKQQQGIVDDLSYRKFYLEHDVEAELETEAVKLEELKAQKEKLLTDRQAEAEREQRAYDYEQGNIPLEQLMAESEVKDNAPQTTGVSTQTKPVLENIEETSKQSKKKRTQAEREETFNGAIQQQLNILSHQSPERQEYLKQQYEKYKQDIEGLEIGDTIIENDTNDIIYTVKGKTKKGVCLVGDANVIYIPYGTLPAHDHSLTELISDGLYSIKKNTPVKAEVATGENRGVVEDFKRKYESNYVESDKNVWEMDSDEYYDYLSQSREVQTEGTTAFDSDSPQSAIGQRIKAIEDRYYKNIDGYTKALYHQNGMEPPAHGYEYRNVPFQDKIDKFRTEQERLMETEKQKVIKDYSEKTHKAMISDAVNAGFDVPENILRKYPYLKKKYDIMKLNKTKQGGVKSEAVSANRGKTGAVIEVGRRTESDESIQGEYFSPAEPQGAKKAVKGSGSESLNQVAKSEAAPSKETQRITGNTTKAYDNDNNEYDFQYAVVSADSLIASHDTNMNQNPSYPQELQPRDRERIASKIQVDKMAFNIQPELLGESPKIQDGAPIIGKDNIVESGNGRVIALKKMYQTTKANKEKYINWLKDNAEKFGIDVSKLPENPVLVRVRQTDVNRNEFVKKANETSVALMSSTETAKSDAERLTDRILGLFEASEDGTINTVGNRPFISAFTREIIPGNEVGRYVTPEGYLSQDGLTRVRNAIFYKAYGSDKLLTRISESTDNNIRNITNSLINIAPKVVKIKNGITKGTFFDIDFSSDIVSAVEQYLSLKNSKLSVDEYLRQQTLFDDGVSQSAKVILGVIDENSRSAKKITEFLNTVLDAVEELGNPDQVSLFGEQTDISKGELIKYAYRRFDDGGQQTLEQITEDRPGERQEDKRISRPKDGRQKTEGKREKSEEVNTLTSSASVSLPQGTNTGVFAKTMDDLVEIIENFTGVPIRTGKFKQRALGIFKVQSEVIRTKIKNDLPVICHELGHYLDKKHGFYGSKIHDSELIPLGRQTSRASYSQTAIRKEGVAEFLRIYLTDHIRAKNIAPNFLAHFESVIGYDELNFLSQLRTDVTSIINLKPENRVYNSVSSYEGRTTITKKAPLFHRLINQWIDKEAVVGRIQKEAEKKGYTGTNIKTTFENLRGLDAQVETMIMDNQRDVNGKVIFKSLAEIFEPISKKACKKLGYDPVQVREHFIAYMVSRRAMDYRARNLTMPDTWATYQDTITRLESKYGKLFTDLFDDIRKWEDNSLEMLVESGIKSRQEIKMIKILNANHIPLQRIQETIDVIRAGSGSSVGQSKQVVKRAVGSGATIIDPIESIITNAFIITRAAKSNNALRVLKNMTSIDGMGKWIEAVPNKTHSENFSVKDVRTQMIKIAKANNDINLEEALKNMTDEELESGLSIFYTLPKEGDKEITIYENGKGRLYEVDAELYKAIKGLNKEQSNIVIRILNMPKRVLQFGVVTTVEFMIRNMNRDTFTSLIQSDVAINPVEIIKGYISAFKKDSDYRELVAMGGATEFLNIRSRTEAQKLEDKVLGYGFAEKFKRFAANVAEVRINNNQRTRAKLVQSISTLVGTIPDAIRSLVDWSEMGPRVAEYRKALAKGYSKEEAAALARKVTQDFLRSGYYGKEVSKVTAFFNANIQGTTRQVETFAQNPGRTLLRGFAYITLPTLLLYFINYDDEDYQALPNWRKTLFWNIPIGDRKFFSIPRPYGYSLIFGAVPEIVLDKVLVDDIKTFERIKESFIQNFDIPVIPSALKPAIEVKANKQWNDTPIEGTWDRVNYPAYLIRNEKTSTISKALGDFFKNEEGLSPKQIDYLIKGYFGSVGEFIYRTPDTIKDGVEMPADWTDLPIIKEFITDSVYTNDNINTLYDYSSELTKRAKEYKQTGEYPSLEKIENKKRKEKILNELDNLRLESNQVIAKLTDERKAIKTIEADKKLSASIREAKAREIRYWMNKEAEAFNKKYELLKKKYNLK